MPRIPTSRSNPAQSGLGSQHLIQPQCTYRWRTSVARLSRRSIHRDPATQVPAVDITAPEIEQAVPIHWHDHEQHAANDIQAPATPHHDSSGFTGMQAEGRNTLPNNSGPVTVPSTTLIQGAQSVNISGHPRFMTIGTNMGNLTTVNNYGGTHGLEKLENFVAFAALHDSAEHDPTRRCHPGTRQSVLNQLRDWFNHPNATDSICWLHGPAGAGKSAIAQTIADEYKERGVAATFFFYRSDPERSNGNQLFPTIAWQLAFSIPVIKGFIVHALDKTPHLPMKDVETQFEQLVVYPCNPTNNITSHLPQSAPVVIIDGLDECSDEQLQRRIIAVIGNTVKDCLVPLHFLICSRPEAVIEEALDQFKHLTLRIDLAKLDDSNRDVEKYLMDQFSDIRSKRRLAPTWPGPKIIEELVFKSSGNFILAATVMRYISDEDCDPEEQLDIVQNLKPHGKTSPFALLDELYLEILKRHRDQDFLKTFLALLVGRGSIDEHDLHEDDATLMNVSEKNLHMKLRRMRSLLKFEPFIDVHHKSFLDFLQDPSRSGQYHVSEQDAQKRYLELIVNCVVRHISMAMEQANGHGQCCSRPKFRSIVERYPLKIVLPAEDWHETLQPLLDLQDRLLNTCKPQSCHVTQVMREFLLHLMILQRTSQLTTAGQALESNLNEPVTTWNPAPVTEAQTNLPENDLDRCLSDVLLSCLENPNSALAGDTVMIERMSSLLAFDYAETATRVRSVTDAQKLVDLIDLVINNETFINQCSRDAARNAALLASKIYARVPLLPLSVFLNGPTQKCDWFQEYRESDVEHTCSSAFISRILDRNYILSSFFVYEGDNVKFVDGDVNEQHESVDKWLKRSSPNLVTRMRVMLEVARIIRYIHSMDFVVALESGMIESVFIALDSNCCAKICFGGLFTWQVRQKLIYDTEEFTYRSNVSSFAKLFEEVCFDDDNKNHPNHLVEDAIQLIERCLATIQPTMEDVVKEMETWNLT